MLVPPSHPLIFLRKLSHALGVRGGVWSFDTHFYIFFNFYENFFYKGGGRKSRFLRDVINEWPLGELIPKNNENKKKFSQNFA